MAQRPPVVPRAWLPDRRGGFLLAGAVLLVLLGAAATVVLPAADPALETASDFERAYDEQATTGMRLFAREGCWYCHSQQVREVRTDTGVGDPLQPGDYAADRPAMLGRERVGPDLTHAAGRFEDAEQVKSLLRDPRAKGRHSSMPSYAYLSDGELDALAKYVLSLK